MKIIFATSTPFHLRHLARELALRGHDVEFHSYHPAWRLRELGLPPGAIRSHFIALLPWSGLALLRLSGSWLLKVREALFARVDRRIAAKMARADVFIGLSAIAVESARKAKDGGALVLIERGSSHILQQCDTARREGIRAPSTDYVERELASYAAADRIVLLSQFSRRSFLDHGEQAERIEVMPLGVDLARFSAPANPPPLPVRALVVGVWSRRKGCDLLAPLLERLPSLLLTHVGLVQDAPLPRSARFRQLGHLDHAALAAEMRQHHLLIFPSRDDGFGMVMAEALACGLRVVASDASGGPDLAAIVGTDHVRVVPAGDSEALEQAVCAQIAAIEAQPDAFAPPSERVAALSWQGYAERYEAMTLRLRGATA